MSDRNDVAEHSAAPPCSHDCANEIHRKGILSPNRSKMRWEIKCDACGYVAELWVFGTPRPPRPLRNHIVVK